MDAVSRFTALLADDPSWRGKVLKILQFAARLAALNAPPAGRAAGNSALSTIVYAALPSERRATDVSVTISTARRVMAFMDALVAIRAAARAVAASVPPPKPGTPAFVRAFEAVTCIVSSRPTAITVFNAVAAVADDVSTATRIGILDGATLPLWFGQLHARLWAAQCIITATFASVHLMHATREAAATPPDGGADARRSQQQLQLAKLGMLRAAADVAASVPAAIDYAVPPWMDAVLGLTSATLAARRSWVEAAFREEHVEVSAPTATQQSLADPEDSGESAASAGGASLEVTSDEVLAPMGGLDTVAPSIE